MMKKVGLVSYSSSSSSESDDDESRRKQIKRIKSDEAPVQTHLTNGTDRVRVFPHEQGNWAISIFAPVQCSSHLDVLIDDLIETVQGGWKRLNELHISLSRTFPIRFLHIESIRSSLKKELALSPIKFTAQIENVTILDNDDRSTSFLVFTLDQHRQFRRLIQRVDRVLEKYRYPTYYENPCFHVSFAYSTDANREKLVPEQCESILKQYRIQPSSISIPIDQICFKAGHRLYQLNIGSSS